jgi:hypothetical protein
LRRHTKARPGRRAPLPKCDTCGKACYPSRVDAGRDRDRFDLARIYTCEGGGIHLTRHPSRQPTKGYRRPPKGKNVDTTTQPAACPVCKIGEGAAAPTTSCPHPIHWPDRDPERPYFPDVTAEITGQTSNVFMGQAIIARALRKAGQPDEVVRAFGTDLRSSEDYSAALACMTRWVNLA